MYKMLPFPLNLKWKKEQLLHLMLSKFFGGIPWIHLHVEMNPLILPG